MPHKCWVRPMCKLESVRSQTFLVGFLRRSTGRGFCATESSAAYFLHRLSLIIFSHALFFCYHSVTLLAITTVLRLICLPPIYPYPHTNLPGSFSCFKRSPYTHSKSPHTYKHTTRYHNKHNYHHRHNITTQRLCKLEPILVQEHLLGWLQIWSPLLH